VPNDRTEAKPDAERVDPSGASQTEEPPDAPQHDGSGEAAPTRRPRGPWRRPFQTALSVWGAATLAYFSINVLVWMLRSESGPLLSGMLEVWNRWDTGHYTTIATTGYNPQTENTAFFPLYPVLIRLSDPVLPGGALSAGLIISHAACIAALTVLYRLTGELLGEDVAQRTVFYLMAFPFAFFLVAAYNESLFLLFSVSALYCMRRGYWWTAGWLGLLASATRQAGLLLALAFAVEYLRQRGWKLNRVRWNALAVGLVPLGVVAYAVFLWRAFGDPLKFVHVQALWGREASWPWEGTVRAIEVIRKASVDGYIFQPLVIMNVIDILAVVVTGVLLVLSVVGRWRLGTQSLFIVAWAAASYLMVVVSPIGLDVPLHSTPRYVLETLPAFMVVAQMGRNEHLHRLYLVPAIAVQGVLVLGYFNNIWLA